MMKRVNQYLMASLCGALLVSGCSRDIESKDPIRSLPDAPPAPIHITAIMNDRSVTLAWEVSDTAAVDRFRIYASEDTGRTYNLMDSTGTFSRELTGLPFNQDVRIRLTSVSTRGLESAPSSTLDVITGLMQILLQDGEAYTRARDVEVSFSAPVVPMYVELSEDPDFGDAVIQEFRAPMPFVLSQGDGIKTVYARLTFSDGSQSGDLLSDQIILDTYALIDSVYFAPVGQTFSSGDTVSFFVSAHGESGGGARASFGAGTNVLLRDLGQSGDLVAGDGIYSFAWVVPIGLTVTDGVVTGTFTDAAGNNAVQAQSSRTIDIHTTQPPEPVILAVGLIEPETAHLSWTANDDEDFESYRVYRSVSPGIDVSDDFLIINITTAQGQTFYDDYLSSAGTYYYRVFVFDSEGLSTGSNEVVVSR